MEGLAAMALESVLAVASFAEAAHLFETGAFGRWGRTENGGHEQEIGETGVVEPVQ